MTVNVTSRLSLEKPTKEEFMALGDTILTANYNKIDLNCHQRIVANIADIVTPYEGESIYATVPVHNYVRKAGAWVQTDGVPPPASGGARGFKGEANDLVQKTYSTGLVDVLLYSITFTAELGRRYLIHYNFNAVREADVSPPTTSNGWIDANFRWNTGGTVNNTHTQIGARKEYRVFSSWDSAGTDTATGHDINGFIEFFPNIAGTVTVGLFTQLHASVFWWVNLDGRYESSFHIMDWDN